MFPFLLTILSNNQPFSCACERVVVTLKGDVENSHSHRGRTLGGFTSLVTRVGVRAAGQVAHAKYDSDLSSTQSASRYVGVYTLMQNVTSFQRPVYTMSHPAKYAGTRYLHSMLSGGGQRAWCIGDNYTSRAGWLSSWSLESTCPESSSSWEYFNGTAWDSGSGGVVDVACCSASCEDDYARADEADDNLKKQQLLLALLLVILLVLSYCVLYLCRVCTKRNHSSTVVNAQREAEQSAQHLSSQHDRYCPAVEMTAQSSPPAPEMNDAALSASNMVTKANDLCTALGIDSALPLPQVVQSAHLLMKTDPQGSLFEQVERLHSTVFTDPSRRV
jgi:hypothetical protein